MDKWQSDILDAMAKNKGNPFVISTPRQSGKSAYNRLLQDIFARPVDEITLFESKLHGVKLHGAKPVGGSWIEMEVWCIERFGSPGDIWNTTIDRWYRNDRSFFFRDEADRTMFVLKWR